MPLLGLCNTDREHLNQIHGAARVSPMGDRPTSMTVNTGKWSKPPTPISTPSNTVSSFNPFSGRTKDNLHARDGNPNRSATLVAGAKRKRPKIENTFNTDKPWVGPRTNKRPQVMLARDSEPDTKPPPESINISDEEGINSLDPLERNLSQKTRFDGSMERSNGLRKLSEHRPAFVADTHSAPSPSSSIESFGEEDKPGNVMKKVNHFEGLADDNNGRGSELDLRKVKDRMKGRGRGRVQTTFTEYITTYEPRETIATSTTQYENKGKAKQSDIRIPISEWYMGSLHVLEPCTLSVVGTCLQIQSSPSCKPSLRFSEINSVTLTSSASDTDVRQQLCLQIVTKPSRSLASSWESEDYFQPGERGQGMLTFRVNTNDRSWSLKKWDALKHTLRRNVDNYDESLGTKAMWELASRAKIATRSNGMIVEDEDETPATITSNTTLLTTTTKVAKDRSPSNREGIHKYLETSRPKRQATYGSTGSRSFPPASNRAEEDTLPRRSIRQVKSKQSVEDSDAVILVYPPSTTGAVNITNADLNRLQPGEFLNDTLIEFGLKLWHKELEETNRGLADQIHIFNSFFYKKLNKKNIEESYKTVARWTSKIDIFKKKYIVVPINENVHWYLAIIYQPQYVLFPPQEKVPPATRGRVRLSQAQSAAEDEAGESVQDVTGVQADVTTDEAKENMSETAIGIDDCTDELKTSSMDEEEIDELANDSEKEPDLNIVARITTPHDDQFDSDFAPMEVDNDDDGGSSESVSAQLQDISVVDDDDVTMSDLEELKVQGNKTPAIQPISTKDFYVKPPSGKGKEKALEVEHIEVVNSSPETMKTMPYIIIMDSLGSKHPRAMNTLASYLKFEAMDKKEKGSDSITKAVGKYAQVPLQPNFCDCGIYLLHFVRTFVSKTDHLLKVITRERAGRSVPQSERHEDWEARNVDGHRQRLSDRIKELSMEWKKDRATRAAEETEQKKQTKVVEVIGSSDSEIDIVGESTNSKKKVPRQNSKQSSKQNTRKVSRLR